MLGLHNGMGKSVVNQPNRGIIHRGARLDSVDSKDRISVDGFGASPIRGVWDEIVSGRSGTYGVGAQNKTVESRAHKPSCRWRRRVRPVHRNITVNQSLQDLTPQLSQLDLTAERGRDL